MLLCKFPNMYVEITKLSLSDLRVSLPDNKTSSQASLLNISCGCKTIKLLFQYSGSFEKAFVADDNYHEGVFFITIQRVDNSYLIIEVNHRCYQRVVELSVGVSESRTSRVYTNMLTGILWRGFKIRLLADEPASIFKVSKLSFLSLCPSCPFVLPVQVVQAQRLLGFNKIGILITYLLLDK